MYLFAVAALSLMSLLLTPAKSWYAPDQAWMVNVKGTSADTRLVVTDFSGKPAAAAGKTDVTADGDVDLRKLFPELGKTPQTYLVYLTHGDQRFILTPKPGAADAVSFVGTPLVLDVREDERRPGSGAMVVRVQPLEYAVISTDAGPVTAMFYYDAAPNTVENFVRLSREGFYDGLTFHRIVPGFVVQGGDPTGTGTGGPGYHIEAEFNDRPHLDGVLSMARSSDPNEAAGALPRAEFANSAGSQSFICLDYSVTRKLDHRYTAFGRVSDGMDAVLTIAKTPLAEPRTGKPQQAQVIKSVQIMPVTPEHNPYAKTVKLESVPTTAPVSAPVPAPATQEVPLTPPERAPALEENK
jgi:peptidyl-prolyl cis-trans isomerase B (cyclophilin B)